MKPTKYRIRKNINGTYMVDGLFKVKTKVKGAWWFNPVYEDREKWLTVDSRGRMRHVTKSSFLTVDIPHAPFQTLEQARAFIRGAIDGDQIIEEIESKAIRRGGFRGEDSL